MKFMLLKCVLLQFFQDTQTNGHSEYAINVRGGGYIHDHGDVEAVEHSHEELMTKVDAMMTKIVKVSLPANFLFFPL